MSDAAILGLTGSFMGVCGIVIAAIVSKKKSNPGGNPGNPGNHFVRESTFNIMHEGLNKSLDALWTEFRVMDEKVDKILLLVKG